MQYLFLLFSRQSLLGELSMGLRSWLVVQLLKHGNISSFRSHLPLHHRHLEQERYPKESLR